VTYSAVMSWLSVRCCSSVASDVSVGLCRSGEEDVGRAALGRVVWDMQKAGRIAEGNQPFAW
jgi:hypothetical protein